MTKLLSSVRVYRDVTTLMVETLEVVVSFPKTYKYTVGEKMQNLTMDMAQQVAQAYITKDLRKKIDSLDTFQADFNVLKTLYRIAGEKQWMSLGRRAHMIELMESIGKQSTAWKNSVVVVLKSKNENPQGQG
jgi:hypothetical protein